MKRWRKSPGFNSEAKETLRAKRTTAANSDIEPISTKRSRKRLILSNKKVPHHLGGALSGLKPELLDGDLRASCFESCLCLVYIFLLALFDQGCRSSIYKILRFLQAEA